MMTKTPRIYCYGELLWDCFPDREILGGALFNVAYRLHSLEAEVQLLSAVGDDPRGQEALNGLVQFGLNIKGIQVHKDLETGYVKVHLDTRGAATYSIGMPVAWDRITALARIDPDSILIFGSLALRQDYNKRQIKGLMDQSKLTVFDINLRPPHYDFPYLLELINACDCLKLNEEELPEVLDALEIEETSLEDQLCQLAKVTITSIICVTLGSEGAALWHQGRFYSHRGFPAVVFDTVGAGDAFLAGFVKAFFLNQSTPQQALEYGCALGSLVASKEGATAPVEISEINRLINQ